MPALRAALGGECGEQSLIGYPDRGERANIDARRASRAANAGNVHLPRSPRS